MGEEGLSGIAAEYAPSIVISSLASMTIDSDYNYGGGVGFGGGGGGGGGGGFPGQSKAPKPMTAKDRARHGMLRTMLRKSLEVTRPNWPKHPSMLSTDRVLDEEDRVRKVVRKGAKNAFGAFDMMTAGGVKNSSGFLTAMGKSTETALGGMGEMKPFKPRSVMKTNNPPIIHSPPSVNSSFLQGSFSGFGSENESFDGTGLARESLSLVGSQSLPNIKSYNPSPSASNLTRLKTAELNEPGRLRILANRANFGNRKAMATQTREEKGLYRGTRNVRKM